MLTKEDNEILTRVGPGTPMGDVMRRYWVPVVLSAELEAGGARQAGAHPGRGHGGVPDRPGRDRALGTSIARTGASPSISDAWRQTACVAANHGWKYGLDGRCLEMPNEAPETDFKHAVRHPPPISAASAAASCGRSWANLRT